MTITRDPVPEKRKSWVQQGCGGYIVVSTCCRCCVSNGVWGTKAVWYSWARTATRPTPAVASPGRTRRPAGWPCSGGPAATTWPDWTGPLRQCCAAAGTDAAAAAVAGDWATRAPQTGSCWWSATRPTRRRTRTTTVWRTIIVAGGKKNNGHAAPKFPRLVSFPSRYRYYYQYKRNYVLLT